jgi:hypothetical protein
VFANLDIQQIKSNRTNIENTLKDELNMYFKDKGINCEGVLLSEVSVVRAGNKETPIVVEDHTQTVKIA